MLRMATLKCASCGALAGKGKPIILYRLAHLWRYTVAPNHRMIVTQERYRKLTYIPHLVILEVTSGRIVGCYFFE